MSQDKELKPTVDAGMGRRRFINTAALVGLTVGVAACNDKPAASAAPEAAPVAATKGGVDYSKYEVHPGQLDDYYAFSSGGHSGDCRIYGLPSGRLLKSIPVFNMDCMVGWGITNESKKIIGTKADGSVKYKTGDTHHVHPSYKDGTYDGKYMFVNDKIHGRLARIRMDTMETDKIVELPLVQGFHGTFPDKRDPVDQAINHTTRVFCGGEFSIPLDNNGKNMDATADYRSIFTCVDSESMEVRWQVLIDGNCDLVATSYDGKLAATNQYNTENGVHYEDMMSAEMDACLFFNIARIEEAVKAGKFKSYGGSKVPVVDGTKASNPDPKTALVCYVPVSKNPHGVNASPDGKYYACSGKLSPTATVIEHALVLKWFDGELKEARETVVAEPEIGLGPLHTGFDGRGNAYTTLFLDSQIVKWNVEAAIKSFKGDKTAKVVVDRLDVMYQPGHGFTSMGETKDADGKYFLSDNKFSKDRFLPVGPLHPETGQLIDISGEKMVLVHDHSLYSEPHDSIIIPRNLIRTRQVYDLNEFPLAVKDAEGLPRGAQGQEGYRVPHFPGAHIRPARVDRQAW